MKSIHHHNSQILQKVLSHPAAPPWSGVTRRQVIDWYENRFVPETSLESGEFYLTIPTDQSGGASGYVHYPINGTEYYFKVSTVRAEYMGIKQNGEPEYSDGSIYFLSLQNDTNNFNCIHLILQTRNRVGLIQGVTKKFPCVGVKYANKLRLYQGPKEGDILIQGVIEFAKRFKSQLHINELELDDSAAFICGQRQGPGAVPIELTISNQLQGKLPFYMKYGFQPREVTALAKIKDNLSRMKSFKVDSRLAAEIETITHTELPEWFRQLLTANLGKSLKSFLELVSRTDCLYYSKFYRQLYDRLGLFRLEGDESVYVLNL